MMFALVAVLAVASEAPEVEQRVVEAKRRDVQRVEGGPLNVTVEAQPDRVAVKVVENRRCLVDVVEARVVETVQINPWAIPAAVGSGAVGVGGLVVAGGMAAFAPSQPPADDQFSRGQLSREGAYGIAVASGVVGVLLVGGGVAIGLFGREQVLGKEKNDVVLATNDGHCAPAARADMDVALSTWNARRSTARTNGDGVADVAFTDADLALPSDATTPWATVSVSSGGKVVFEAPVGPPPAAFVARLLRSQDIAEMKRFHDRFSPHDTAEWAQLQPRYDQLRRERGEAEVAAALKLADADPQAAQSKLDSAKSFGVEDAGAASTVKNSMSRAGEKHAKNAIALAHAGKTAEAEHEAELADGFGADRAPIDAAINMAKLAEGQQHAARARALLAQGKAADARDEASAASTLGVEMGDAFTQRLERQEDGIRRAEAERREASMTVHELETEHSQLARKVVDTMRRSVRLNSMFSKFIDAGYRARGCAELGEQGRRAVDAYCAAVGEVLELGKRSRDVLARQVGAIVAYEEGDMSGAGAEELLRMSLQSNKCEPGDMITIACKE
jgi:hypothetical protein